MQNNVFTLHSHSGLEREIKMPKHLVLVDEEFIDLFLDCGQKLARYTYRGKVYYKVPILSFVHKGGVFKNFNE